MYLFGVVSSCDENDVGIWILVNLSLSFCWNALHTSIVRQRFDSYILVSIISISRSFIVHLTALSESLIFRLC